jgi:hypothetical protein
MDLIEQTCMVQVIFDWAPRFQSHDAHVQLTLLSKIKRQPQYCQKRIYPFEVQYMGFEARWMYAGLRSHGQWPMREAWVAEHDSENLMGVSATW